MSRPWQERVRTQLVVVWAGEGDRMESGRYQGERSRDAPAGRGVRQDRDLGKLRSKWTLGERQSWGWGRVSRKGVTRLGWEVGLGVANNTDQNSLIFCSSGTRRGVVGFKGCSPAASYPPQVSYLISPPGLSIASYSRICRTYLCNNLTDMDHFVKLKANTSKTLAFSSHSCPTCVGEHSKSCLPNFVTTESCPTSATKCYSSTLKFQAGERKETFFSNACSMSGAVWCLPVSEGGGWDSERGLGCISM